MKTHLVPLNRTKRLSCLLVLLASSTAGCFSSSSKNAPPDGGGQSADDAGQSLDDGGSVSDDANTTTTMPSEPDGGSPGTGTAEGGVADAGGPDHVMPEAGTPATVTGTGPVPPPTLPTTMVTGSAPCTISTPTVWSAAVYVVDCSDYLEVDSALTIDQGTVIKFAAGNYVRVSSTGTVSAAGGSAYPIVFTSLKDDAYGGDTNGDGTATAPAPGDWAGVRLDGTNNSTFGECGFYYSGGGQGAMTDTSAAPVSVTNSIFAHNQPTADAISSAPALDLSSAPAGSVVTGNLFYDNRVPLGINATISLDDSNSFDNALAAPSHPQPNEYNGVVVNTGPNLDGHISWKTTKIPIVIPNSYLQIDSQGTLSLGDGVVLKFGSGAYVRVDGVLSAPGNHGIVFTSIKDDAQGGDTNGDGTATTPTSGDWNGVQLGTSTGTSFKSTGFYYAGGGGASALSAGNNTLTVENCTFGHDRTTIDAITANAALDLSNAAAGTVATGNVFYDNRVPLSIAPTLSIDDSNSFDNSAAAPSQPQPNEYNGIVVNTGPNLNGTVSWSATKVPFALAPYLEIESTGTLSLGNNVILKFFAAANSGINVSQGGVLSAGTGVVLTSIRDDAHGGDTNGDGSATAAAPGDWWGVSGYNDSSLGSTSAPLTCESVGTEYFASCQ